MPATPTIAIETFDALISTTLRNYAPKLEDNVFTKRAFLNWLKSKDRVKNKDGGTAIVVPIIYGLNDTVASYSGYDTLSTAPQEGITAAQFDWAQYAAAISISGIEEAANSGASQVLDLLEAKTMQAEESIAEKMNYMFLQDGSGNAGKDFLGLSAIVSTTDNAYGSAALGGIPAASTSTDAAGASFEYWKSQTGGSGALTIAMLSTLYNACSRGTNDFPDLMLTDSATYSGYEALLQPQLRFSNSKSADAGFENLMYKGATVFWDAFLAASSGSRKWYMVNSKYITLNTLKGKWMQTTDFVKPPNQDAKFAQILSYGQLTASCRYKHGVLSSLT